MAIAEDPEMPGYKEFEKEAWAFKVSSGLQCGFYRLYASCVRKARCCGLPLPMTTDQSDCHFSVQHDRLNVERRMASSTQSGETLAHTSMGEIKTSDVARLMELFQASLYVIDAKLAG